MENTTLTLEQITKELNIELTINNVDYKSMPWDDGKIKRFVFNVTLSTINGQYTCDFGQSIAKRNEEPTIEDIISAMTWYDPESFEDFCSNFGYDTDSKKAYDTYLACWNEFEAMQSLFDSYFDDMVEISNEF